MEVVVARYSEKINWLKDDKQFEKYKKTIYNKGEVSTIVHLETCVNDCSITSLPNVGREGHTYLYHIINRYETLSDVTVFLPGSCFDEIKRSSTQSLMDKVENTKNTVIAGKWYVPSVKAALKKFTIGEWTGHNESNVATMTTTGCQPSSIRPYGRWYDHYFKDVSINVVSYTSTFAIAKEHILQHSKDYYMNLLSALGGHCNPEDGHYIERSWVAVFHPIPVSINNYTNIYKYAFHAHSYFSTITITIQESCLISARPMSNTVQPQAAPNIFKGVSSMSSMMQLYANRSVKVASSAGATTASTTTTTATTTASTSTADSAAIDDENNSTSKRQKLGEQ